MDDISSMPYLKPVKDLSLFSEDSNSTSGDNDNMWLYNTGKGAPKYERDKDYNNECLSLSTSKNSLEAILKNYLLVNNFLKEECKGVEKLINTKETESVHRNIFIDFEDESSKKRVRRLDIQIEKNFNCGVPGCKKVYGSRDA